MIPADKLMHMMAGAIVAAGVLPFGKLPAFIAVVLIGGAKEFYDWASNWRARLVGLPPPHEVSPEDFAATLLGGILFLAGNDIMTSLVEALK